MHRTAAHLKIIVWLRRHEGQVALVAVNNSAQARQVALVLPADLAGTRLLDADDGRALAAEPGPLRLQVPPPGGKVWLGR